jgi:hypothetical protein
MQWLSFPYNLKVQNKSLVPNLESHKVFHYLSNLPIFFMPWAIINPSDGFLEGIGVWVFFFFGESIVWRSLDKFKNNSYYIVSCL